jgi:hypothetical protein
MSLLRIVLTEDEEIITIIIQNQLGAEYWQITVCAEAVMPWKRLQAYRPSESIEAQVTCKDGGVRTVMISGIIIGDDILTAFVDITELRVAVVELQRRNDELERFNRVTVGRELDMISLKQQINALSRQLGREPPYPLSFLDTPSAQSQEGEAQ